MTTNPIPHLDLDTLARECGVTVDDVAKAIRAGVAAGLLRVVDDGDPSNLIIEAVIPDA